MVFAIFSVIFSGIAGMVGYFKAELQEHTRLNVHHGARDIASSTVHGHEERRLSKVHPDAVSRQEMLLLLESVRLELKQISSTQGRILQRLK